MHPPGWGRGESSAGRFQFKSPPLGIVMKYAGANAFYILEFFGLEESKFHLLVAHGDTFHQTNAQHQRGKTTASITDKWQWQP